MLPPRTPEQAAALVEALLTGPLAKDLEEVGIAVEDVRRALAGTKDAAGVAAVPKLFGAGAAAVAAVDAGPVAVVEHLRLHYSHEAAAAAHQHYRRILDGPFGYAPENDALSRWLGSCLTASSMLAAVWWLTAGTAEESGFPPLLAALVVGPAGLLLGTGRGLVVLQSLYVTLLAGLVCVPLYHWGYEIISRCVLCLVACLGDLIVDTHRSRLRSMLTAHPQNTTPPLPPKQVPLRLRQNRRRPPPRARLRGGRNHGGPADPARKARAVHARRRGRAAA